MVFALFLTIGIIYFLNTIGLSGFFSNLDLSREEVKSKSVFEDKNQFTVNWCEDGLLRQVKIGSQRLFYRDENWFYIDGQSERRIENETVQDWMEFYCVFRVKKFIDPKEILTQKIQPVLRAEFEGSDNKPLFKDGLGRLLWGALYWIPMDDKIPEFNF